MDIYVVDMSGRDAGRLVSASEDSVLYTSTKENAVKACNVQYALLLRFSQMSDARGTQLKEGDIIAIMEVRRLPDSGFIVGRRLPTPDSYLEVKYLESRGFYFLDVSGTDHTLKEGVDTSKYERVGNVHVDNFI